ncbi:MAG: hypothetical protein JOZ41_22015 [Chloroflexi bacterium]|nr:hypothetical protein [Chloroflexota bacterium]
MERWTDVKWNIGREGRAWSSDEFLPRLDLAPEKMEAIDGKLFWDDNQRMMMLGLLLENIGTDKAIRLGDPKIWREAIAELEDMH